MTKEERKIRNAWVELLAAIGTKKNIVAIGAQKVGNQYYTSLHLLDVSKVKFDAFIYMNNVYCLEQTQGISIVWEDSVKAESFTDFLKEMCPDKFGPSKKIKIYRKVSKEQEVRPYNFEEEKPKKFKFK